MGEDAADPLQRWKQALQEWGIPEEILRAAPESPWALPPALFARRADAEVARRPDSVAHRRAVEALQPRGTVLDVGAGAGAASLPLAEWTIQLVAVDTEREMLEELRPRAAALGLPLTLVEGRWPEVAHDVGPCDVSVCSHVLYNVQDLGPFVLALDQHTRRRVVVEITSTHPAGTINPLWVRFHGLRRPERPTWEDAVEALKAAGVTPVVERQVRTDGRPHAATFAEMVSWTRRRLCLSPDRDADVAEALVDMGVDPDRSETWSLRPPELVVLWWDRS